MKFRADLELVLPRFAASQSFVSKTVLPPTHVLFLLGAWKGKDQGESEGNIYLVKVNAR